MLIWGKQKFPVRDSRIIRVEMKIREKSVKHMINLVLGKLIVIFTLDSEFDDSTCMYVERAVL